MNFVSIKKLLFSFSSHEFIYFWKIYNVHNTKFSTELFQRWLKCWFVFTLKNLLIFFFFHMTLRQSHKTCYILRDLERIFWAMHSGTLNSQKKTSNVFYMFWQNKFFFLTLKSSSTVPRDSRYTVEGGYNMDGYGWCFLWQKALRNLMEKIASLCHYNALLRTWNVIYMHFCDEIMFLWVCLFPTILKIHK